MSYISQGSDKSKPKPEPDKKWWESVTSFIGDVGGGAVKVYGETQRQAGAAQAWQQQTMGPFRPTMPTWVAPVGIGAGILVLIMVMRK